MRLSGIARVYWVWLKARAVLTQELLACLGLTVGVALLFASQIASVSLNDSVQTVTSGLVGQMQFQLDARDLEGFSEQLLGDVRGLPGVRLAVPVLQEPVTITGPAGERTVELIGTQPVAALNTSPLLRSFNVSEIGLLSELMLPVPVAEQLGVHASASRKLRLLDSARSKNGFHPDESLKLSFDGHTVTTRFGRSLAAKQIGRLVDSPVAIAWLTYAQRLTGMQERLSRIFVRVIPGHAREVRAALMHLAAGSLNVEPANFDATLFGVAAAPADQSQDMFSGISALIGFLFAFNAMLLTLPMRRGLITSLRINGATRAGILKILALDGLVLGVLASLLGLALGDALSLAVFRSNPGYLSLAFPVGSQRTVTWQGVGLPVGAALLAAYAGVLIALPWRSSRRHRAALTTRYPAHWARSRAILVGGLLCIALTEVIFLAVPQSPIAGSASLVLALLLLLPGLLGVIVGAFDRIQARFKSAATRIAVIELRSPKTWARSIAIAATGAIAVFGSVSLEGARANLQRGLDSSTHDLASAADLWIVPSGGTDVLATTPFAEDQAFTGRLVNSLGVRAVGVYRASFLDYGNRRVWVMAPPSSTPHPIPPSQLAEGELALATARLRAGGWAVLSQALAEEHHLHIGELFTLPSPRPTTYRLAAMSTNLGWPPGTVILNPHDYARTWGSAELGAYSVMLAPRASATAVREELLQVLAPGSGLTVETARHREHSMRLAIHQGLSRLGQIATLVFIAAVLAMSISMGAMIWQRRDRLARLKMQGYQRGPLWRAVIYESTLLLAGGCVIGAAFGVYGQLAISHALASVTGFPIVYSAGVWVAVLSTALISAGAVTLVTILGYLAASVPPGV